MLAILLSIITATLIFITFRTFPLFKLNNFHAIVVNYIVAATIGFMIDDSGISILSIYTEPWFLMAIVIGVFFISMLNTIAITSQKLGVSVASVSSKMSVVIPVILGVFLYNESMSIIKVIGIIMALASVYLTSQKDDGVEFQIKSLLLPIALFVLGGTVDSLFKLTQAKYIEANQFMLFVASLFATSAVLGLIATFFGKEPIYKIKYQSIVAGVILGVPNFASIYYLMQALDAGYESSLIFPIINMGVVALSTILSFIFFKEKLSPKNWIGIGIAIIAFFVLVLIPQLIA